jgi:hypothetical protein
MDSVTIASTMAMKWRLPEIMREHDLTAYRIGKELGGVTRMSTVYRLADSENPPMRIELETLSEMLDALYKLTGKRFNTSDLLEYTPDN